MLVCTILYNIWILANLRCRTSDVQHCNILMLRTTLYVGHVRHCTPTTSYVPRYDVVRTISYVRTYYVGTYDIECQTYDVVGSYDIVRLT